MAGAKFERQETGLVDAITSAVKKADGPVNLKFVNGASLPSIVKCYKFMGRTVSGSEPLTDIVFEDINNGCARNTNSTWFVLHARRGKRSR